MNDYGPDRRDPKKQDGGKPLPSYEPTPDQLRVQVQRKVIAWLVVMVVLLAGAVLYFTFHEEEAKKIQDVHEPMIPIDVNTSGEAVVSAAVPTAGPPVAAATPLTVDLAWERSMAAADEISPEKMADAMGQVRIANDYLQAREWEQAERHARQALDIWPNMNAALRMMGLIYIQRGQFEQAIAVLETAIKTDPFNAETYNNLATAYMQKRMLDKAEDVYLTSLQIRPGYTIANLNLGLLYILWGRYDQAVDRLELAVEQMPDNASALNNLGVALIRLGQYEEARQYLQRLINRAPDVAAPYFNVAITYVMENNFAEAMEWIRKGAARCSPAACQRFLADSDFESIRGTAEFQAIVRDLYPDLPDAPQG
jgi:Flp pilus assembly protein TadD